ncbi:BON domain-containing protein [Trebonia kvetii]|nr:BON domain-containing protein [Trebonia kvetii]
MGKTRDVREAVETELGYDPLVDATDISVKNIDGEVALTGTVPSYPQYLGAAQAAWRVAGVTAVHNHLEVVLPLGAARDDAMLTTAANNALAADATVPEGVEATARNGNLTLTGTVQYLSQRTAVEKVVSGLIGVRNVRNEIGVVSGVEWAEIKQVVEKALDRSAMVPDDSDVLVDTSGSTVILTGHVRTRAERDAVVGATWMAHGVAAVVDELQVTG